MAQLMTQNKYSTKIFPGTEGSLNFDDEAKKTPGVLNPKEEQTGNTNESSFGNRTAPKHKTSHLRFLIWVAFVRKQSPNIDETKRRTCPLKGCERPFETPDVMLQHVYNCPRLEKNGIYECCDCKKEERVSKCHTNGCYEPRPFSTVTNSFRRAKRFLSSHHGPKNLHVIEDATKSSPAPQEQVVELPTPEEQLYSSPSELPVNSTSFATELDTPCRENLQRFISEIHSFERAAKSPVYGNPYSLYGGLQSQDMCSELCAGHDAAYNHNHQSRNQDALAELSSDLEPAWAMADYGHQQNAFQWAGSQPCAEYDSKCNIDEYSALTQANDYQTLQTQELENTDYGYTSYGGTSSHELQLPVVSPVSEHGYQNYLSMSRTESRTNTDLSVIFTGSISSSRDTSISSFDSTYSRVQHCEKPPTRILEEGSDLLFAEPESLEELMQPVELPTTIESNCPNPTSEHSSERCFPLEESFVSLSQWSTPATKLNQGHHNRHQAQEAAITCLPQSRCIEVRPHSESLPQTSTTITSPCPPPPIPEDSPSNYRCHCGFESQGKEVYKRSNLKRHQNTMNCRRFSPYSRPEPAKFYPCPYPGCDKQFTRSDNLRQHQKNKSHFLQWSLLQGSSFCYQAEANARHDMLERHRYQGVETDGGGGNVWF